MNKQAIKPQNLWCRKSKTNLNKSVHDMYDSLQKYYLTIGLIKIINY